MTHDELLAKINYNLNKEVWLGNLAEALRAVVELHTPIYDNSCSDADCCGGPYPNLCDGCENDYPCKTIQAIEKSLPHHPSNREGGEITHDELVKKVTDLHRASNSQYYSSPLIQTVLRHKPIRVIGLHKPGEFPWCGMCTTSRLGIIVNYPCPIIQEIEKELA